MSKKTNQQKTIALWTKWNFAPFWVKDKRTKTLGHETSLKLTVDGPENRNFIIPSTKLASWHKPNKNEFLFYFKWIHLKTIRMSESNFDELEWKCENVKMSLEMNFMIGNKIVKIV